MTKVGVNENYCAWLHHHSFLPFVQREKVLATCLLSHVCQIFFRADAENGSKNKSDSVASLKIVSIHFKLCDKFCGPP